MLLAMDLGTGHKVIARVGWSDLGWAIENLWAVSMGRQFFYMSTVGPPNKNPCMSTSKNKDINNKSKQNYPNYQMQMMLLKPVLCGRITSNTTNWRAAQYQMNVLVKLGGIMYVNTCSAMYILQCSYLQVFYYKSVFSQFRLGRS